MKRKDTALVQLLLEYGASPDTVDPATSEAVLLEATRLRDAPLVKLLLDFKADVQCKDKDGGTPLHTAAMEGMTEVAELLLLAGADPEASNNIGLTPYICAEGAEMKALFERMYADLSAMRSRADARDAKASSAATPRRVPQRKGAVKTRLEGGEAAAWPPVFVSFRVREAGVEAKLLKAALEARGVGAYVCTTSLSNADDWAKIISDNLANCRMMVVMGTATYGAKGTEIMGTFEELGYAMRHDIPMFVLKMTPRWQEPKAALILENLQAENLVEGDWQPGAALPDRVVDAIVARLQALL